MKSAYICQCPKYSAAFFSVFCGILRRGNTVAFSSVIYVKTKLFMFTCVFCHLQQIHHVSWLHLSTMMSVADCEISSRSVFSSLIDDIVSRRLHLHPPPPPRLLSLSVTDVSLPVYKRLLWLFWRISTGTHTSSGIKRSVVVPWFSLIFEI